MLDSVLPEGRAKILNGILTHRNGPYGYPSWKQVRTGDHPVARHQRKRNIYSILVDKSTGKHRPRRPLTVHLELPNSWDEEPKFGGTLSSKNPAGVRTNNVYHVEQQDHAVIAGDDAKTYWGEHANLVGPYHLGVKTELDETKILHYRESPVVSCYKPMTHVLSPAGGAPAVFKHTFYNNMITLTTEFAKSSLGIKESVGKTIFNEIVGSYTMPAPKGGYPHTFQKMNLKQTIFPRKSLTYTPTARSRPVWTNSPGIGENGYDNIFYRTFWRDEQNLRRRTDNLAKNSQNHVQSTGAIGGPIFAIFGVSHSALGAYGGGTAYKYTTMSYKPQSQQFGYSFACTSPWPLDVRGDISASYLMSSIGATPNSPPEYAAMSAALAFVSSNAYPETNDGRYKVDGAYISSLMADALWGPQQHSSGSDKYDGHAGELVYNTAPTIFYLSGGLEDETDAEAANNPRYLASSSVFAAITRNHNYGWATTASTGYGYKSHDVAAWGVGYRTATASMLYQMHNFPWRQPWYATDKIVRRGPAHNTYKEFSSDTRLMGQDYSILGEFRLSQHMPLLYKMDFKSLGAPQNLNVGYAFLTVDGAYPSGTTSGKIKGENKQIQETVKKNIFYKTYVHSDFIKSFGVVQEAHGVSSQAGGTYKTSKITLTCRAIKKLLPYNGFFPMLRTVQLGALFSQSVGRYLVQSGNLNADPTGAEFVEGCRYARRPRRRRKNAINS